jgi:hypothetical protein
VDDQQRLLRQLDKAWTAFADSYAGLPEARLVELIRAQPAGTLGGRTRARRRRLDTCGHYPEHAAAIRAWRERGP